MQVAVVWLMVEMLQRTDKRLHEGRLREHRAKHRSASTGRGSQYEELNSDEAEDGRTPQDGAEAPEGRRRSSSRPAPASLSRANWPPPDLHTMGHFFLHRAGHIVFDSSVMLHFVSILISYVLAGSIAYGQLFGLRSTFLIIPFVAIFGGVVIFAQRFVQPIVSVFTVLKCTLLLFLIGVVGVVAHEVDLEPHTSWRSIAEPYLIGTVALGGVVNIMPVLYARIPYREDAILKFRWAVTGGVVFCWIMNVLWAVFVLAIVPQTEADAEEDRENGKLPDSVPEVSLEQSAEDGEISTVPVIEIIDAGFRQYHWAAVTVVAFITVSVTVSFMTLGTGMKHVLDGIVRQSLARDQQALEAEREANRDAATVTPRAPRRRTVDLELGDIRRDSMEGNAEGSERREGEIEVLVEEAADRSPRSSAETEGEEGEGGGEGGGGEEGASGLEGESAFEAEWEHGRTPDPRAVLDEAGHEDEGMWAQTGIQEEVEDDRSGGRDRGMERSGSPAIRTWRRAIAERFPFWFSESGRQAGYYVFWFGLILLIAQMNPSGFLVVLEVFTSLALNIEAGFMVGWMFRKARQEEASWMEPEQAPGSQLQEARDQWDARLLTEAEESQSVDTAQPTAAVPGHRVEGSSLAASRPRTGSNIPDHLPVVLSDGAAAVLSWFVMGSFAFAALYDVISSSLTYVEVEGTIWLCVTAIWTLWRFWGWPYFFPASWHSFVSHRAPSRAAVLAGLRCHSTHSIAADVVEREEYGTRPEHERANLRLVHGDQDRHESRLWEMLASPHGRRYVLPLVTPVSSFLALLIAAVAGGIEVEIHLLLGLALMAEELGLYFYWSRGAWKTNLACLSCAFAFRVGAFVFSGVFWSWASMPFFVAAAVSTLVPLCVFAGTGGA